MEAREDFSGVWYLPRTDELFVFIKQGRFELGTCLGGIDVYLRDGWSPLDRGYLDGYAVESWLREVKAVYIGEFD